MSIAELFESGERKAHKGHFKNLVMMARVDGEVSDEERALLTKIGQRIGLTNEQISEISANPERYKFNPPSSKEERYERLVNLIVMVNADNVFELSEINLLQRYGTGLGFTDEQLVEAIEKTLVGLEEGKTQDEIVASFL